MSDEKVKKLPKFSELWNLPEGLKIVVTYHQPLPTTEPTYETNRTFRLPLYQLPRKITRSASCNVADLPHAPLSFKLPYPLRCTLNIRKGHTILR